MKHMETAPGMQDTPGKNLPSLEPVGPAGEVPLRSLAPQSKGRRVFVSNTAHALSVNALFGHVL